MAKYFIEDTTLKSMADTIRSLTGSTAPLTPSEMTAGVQDAKEDVDGAIAALEALGVEIPEGSDIGDLADLVGNVEAGTDTSDATAVASDIMLNKTAYGSDGKLTGTFTIDSEISTQEDLLATLKNLLATKATPDTSVSLQNKTITPTASSQTVIADSGYDGLGEVVVTGDSNLSSENIVSGVSIFGVNGSAQVGGGGSVSSCMGTITLSTPETPTIYYMDGTTNTLTNITLTGKQAIPLQVVTPSILVISGANPFSLSNITNIVSSATFSALSVTGDFTVKI